MSLLFSLISIVASNGLLCGCKAVVPYITLVIALLAPASQAQRVSAKPNQGD